MGQMEGAPVHSHTLHIPKATTDNNIIVGMYYLNAMILIKFCEKKSSYQTIRFVLENLY